MRKLRPAISEKTLGQAKNTNDYTFWVAPRASKHQIKDEVEATFGVHVIGVRTSNIRGETKRGRRGTGKTQTPDRKKAVVRLAEGEKIEIFESKEKK